MEKSGIGRMEELTCKIGDWKLELQNPEEPEILISRLTEQENSIPVLILRGEEIRTLEKDFSVPGVILNTAIDLYDQASEMFFLDIMDEDRGDVETILMGIGLYPLEDDSHDDLEN